MADKSIGNVRKAGRPAINATPLTVRVPPPQLAQLDAWIEQQPETPTRPEAVRQLLEIALAKPKRTPRQAP